MMAPCETSSSCRTLHTSPRCWSAPAPVTVRSVSLIVLQALCSELCLDIQVSGDVRRLFHSCHKIVSVFDSCHAELYYSTTEAQAVPFVRPSVHLSQADSLEGKCLLDHSVSLLGSSETLQFFDTNFRTLDLRGAPLRWLKMRLRWVKRQIFDQ